MTFTCWKPVVVPMSAGLRKFILAKAERGGSRSFCIQDVQESMEDDDPLFPETERLRALHGNVLFNIQEF
jgi:hypothetical protein